MAFQKHAEINTEKVSLLTGPFWDTPPYPCIYWGERFSVSDNSSLSSV